MIDCQHPFISHVKCCGQTQTRTATRVEYSSFEHVLDMEIDAALDLGEKPLSPSHLYSSCCCIRLHKADRRLHHREYEGALQGSVYVRVHNCLQ